MERGERRRSKRRAEPATVMVIFAFWAVILVSSEAAAQRVYDAANTGWDGLSGLVEMARALALNVESPDRLDLAELRTSDAVLLVYPTQRPPEAELTRFVASGGRLGIADDFGASEGLLARFSIRRAAVEAPDAPRVRGNPNLLVARTFFRHPLTEGVDIVVTNHPTVVRHPQLSPLVSFERGSPEGILLTGVVGRGRLVVLSDPSVLLNLMLGFRSNRDLARNLVTNLTHGGSGRLVLVTGDTPIVGKFDPHGREPWPDRVEAFLREIATLDVPPAALVVANVTILALLSLFLGNALAQKAPYRFPWRLAVRASATLTRSSADDLRRARAAAMGGLREDLVHALARRLTLPEHVLAEDLGRALVSRGFKATEALEMEELMHALRSVEIAETLGNRPALGRADLAKLVSRAERLLVRLGQESRNG